MVNGRAYGCPGSMAHRAGRSSAALPLAAVLTFDVSPCQDLVGGVVRQHHNHWSLLLSQCKKGFCNDYLFSLHLQAASGHLGQPPFFPPDFKMRQWVTGWECEVLRQSRVLTTNAWSESALKSSL